MVVPCSACSTRVGELSLHVAPKGQTCGRVGLSPNRGKKSNFDCSVRRVRAPYRMWQQAGNFVERLRSRGGVCKSVTEKPHPIDISFAVRPCRTDSKLSVSPRLSKAKRHAMLCRVLTLERERQVAERSHSVGLRNRASPHNGGILSSVARRCSWSCSWIVARVGNASNQNASSPHRCLSHSVCLSNQACLLHPC